MLMVHTGNKVPYYITHPSTDNNVQIVSLDATMLRLKCSLNINIPPGVVITWLHNGSVISTRTITQDTPVSNSAMLLLFGTLRPSDAGVYQCVFNDTAGFILRRNIIVRMLSKLYVKLPCTCIIYY